MTLTPRQREIVLGISEGLTCPQIARRLGISVRTVHAHIRAIAEKIPGRLTPISRIILKADELLREAA